MKTFSKKLKGSAGSLELYEAEFENQQKIGIIDKKDKAILLPLKVKSTQEVSFLLKKEYKPVLDTHLLSFPTFELNKDENPEPIVRSSGIEALGCDLLEVKIIYMYYDMPDVSTAKTLVYLGVVGDTSTINNNEICEFSADELLLRMRDNSITDMQTVAALAVMLTQSRQAAEYANSIGEVVS